MAKEKNISVQGSQGTIAGSNIDAKGDVIVNGNKITNVYRSYDYQCLAGQIKELEQDLKDIPLEKTKRRLQKSKQLENLRNQEREFKREVVRLAETFTRVDINTDRLKQAKLYFEQGKIREADAILKVEDISHEQEGLLEAKEQKTHELDHLMYQLKRNSNEFLIKAQITATLFDNPGRFEDTCHYFENAIKSYPNFNNHFEYAFFLAVHNQNNKAAMYYKKTIEEYGQDLDLEIRAMTLNNLGVLQRDKNEYTEALRSYAEALNIYRQLAEDKQTYLPYVATTLNNLGILQSDKNEYTEALRAYAEALKIYRELAEENPQTYLLGVATTLNNLGNLQSAKNEYTEALRAYAEALKIYRQLAEENPQTYLPGVATTLNNLGVLQRDKNEYAEALRSYAEALTIRRQLAEENPQTYLPGVAMTLNNLGILQSDKNEYAEALRAYAEALKIYRELAEENPQTYLPDVAMTLNNLGILQRDKNEYAEALRSYAEALKIYRELAEENPQTCLPGVAMTLINLGIYYLESQPDPEKSIQHVSEAIEILSPMVEKVPYTRKYIDVARQILNEWKVD